MEITKKDLNKTVWVKEEYLQKNRKWFIVDAKGQILWRLAVQIAKKLIWKDKAHYCDFWDAGDFVVVINAKDVKFTWNKLQQKMYYRYSWYKWNLKSFTLEQMMQNHPERVIEHAVSWMIPKNRLRDPRLKRLKIFVDANHTYTNLPLEQL